MQKFEQLCNQLNYHFNKVSLLETALTHRSVSSENNERFEFLGDSIVNFIIAEALFEKFPKAREGQLSRLRANLVKGETLAEIAQERSIGDYLILGSGEMKSGGFRRASILADALEAIIAAIYLDAGMTQCKSLVLSWFDARLQATSLSNEVKDAKTQLQEFLQAQKKELPNYQIEKIEGDAHAQTFYVSCQVTGMQEISHGTGSSRRRAEQDAAAEFLSLIQK